MKGDFTRDTFHRRKHYAAVRMQQGRVQTDADWNEQLDLAAHLAETEGADVIGRCGAPKHAAGFEIKPLSGGDLEIEAGRAYVDGILCELEQKALYSGQPDLPQAPLPADPGLYFAYLDVWRRHLTALEDPAIREVALGGPDTATRLKTVWQVKLVEVGKLGDPLTCASDPAGWTAATARPSGRLRARTQPVIDASTPCVVPSTAGYTRLENQLYRVEVHQGGSLAGAGGGAGGPTFKWSRDNGSIVAHWLSQDGAKLTIDSAGRDAVLRFENDRWFEAIDDARELRGEPGLLRRVKSVVGDVVEIDPATGTVDITAFSEVRKLRRWDSDGELAIARPAANGGWLPIEGGLEIFFEDGTYRTGDYWLIPARAFIGPFAGDIEWPSDAGGPRALRPRGIVHHYCKLALLELDAKGGDWQRLADCREVFPPLTEAGCCEVVVRPGESIQAAIDSLPDAGGAVCLKAGRHDIVAAIGIRRSNVTLRGESLGAQVVRGNGITLVDVSDPQGGSLEHVTIEGIAFTTEGDGGGTAAGAGSGQGPGQGAGGGGPAGGTPPAGGSPVGVAALIGIDTCSELAVRSCVLAVAAAAPGAGGAAGGGAQPPVAMAAGVSAVSGDRLEIVGNEMTLVTLGVVVVHSSEAVVAGNVMTAFQVPEKGLDSSPGGEVAVWIDNTFGSEHRVERNTCANFWVGVQIGPGGLAGDGSVVAENDVVRSGTAAGTGALRFAIDVAADRCTVRDNRISIPSDHCGGISVVGVKARIEGNVVDSSAQNLGNEPPIGILLGVNSAGGKLLSDAAVIRGNRVTGFQIGIGVGPSGGVEVVDNWLEGPSLPEAAIPAPVLMPAGIFLAGVRDARVTGNRIARAELGVIAGATASCQFLDNELLDGGSGFSFGGAAGLEVSRNRVERMTGYGCTVLEAAGTVTLSGNRFAFCGYAAAPGQAFGIGVALTVAEVQIDACEVMDTGVSPDFKTLAPLAVGILAWVVWDCRIHGNLVGYSTPVMPDQSAEHRALLLLGWLEIGAKGSAVGGGSLVLDNKLRGPGSSALVQFVGISVNEILALRFSRVSFSNNDCLHWSVPNSQFRPATVFVNAGRAIVAANHFRAFAKAAVAAVDFEFGAGVFVGNSGGPALNFTDFPAPQNLFNLIA